MANGFQGPPAVDFYSTLSGLGDTIAANRAASAKREAFAQATTPGPDGKIDYGRAILGLAQVDPASANILASRQNHEDTLKQQAIESARNAANDKFNHGISSANLGLARSREARDAADYENTPDQYAPNPAAATDATQPKFIDQYAQAKAAGEANAPGGGGLSLNPIYAKKEVPNPNAGQPGEPATIIKTVILQPGKNGKAVESGLPDGVTLDGMGDATIKADAERLAIGGDDSVLKKYDKKGQGRLDLIRLNDEANKIRIARGLTPIDVTQAGITLQGDKARERASGTMEGRMAPASIEAQGAFKIAENAMDNLWRTNSVPLNKIIQMGQAATSNPELKAAAVAANTAVMTYSRAIAPTGVGTVDSQQHAREILATADGPKATKAAFAQLAREVDMAHASPGIAREYFAASRKARMEGKPAPAMPEYQPAQPTRMAPPPEAIEALKQDPRRIADFDAYYGAGSAKAVLGGR